MLAIIGVLEEMGRTAERTQIANKLFGPEFTQALNAGGMQLDLIKFQVDAVCRKHKAKLPTPPRGFHWSGKNSSTRSSVGSRRKH